MKIKQIKLRTLISMPLTNLSIIGFTEWARIIYMNLDANSVYASDLKLGRARKVTKGIISDIIFPYEMFYVHGNSSNHIYMFFESWSVHVQLDSNYSLSWSISMFTSMICLGQITVIWLQLTYCFNLVVSLYLNYIPAACFGFLTIMLPTYPFMLTHLTHIPGLWCTP